MTSNEESFAFESGHTGRLYFAEYINAWSYRVYCPNHSLSHRGIIFNQGMTVIGIADTYAEARANATKCHNGCHSK